MKRFKVRHTYLLFIFFILSVFFITGCGGGGQTGHWLPGTAPTVKDSTRPRVFSTVPATTVAALAPFYTPTPAQPTNTLITALFTEEMSQASIQAPGTVTVACTGLAPCVNGATLTGTASYAVGSKTMVFTPTPAGTLLEAGKTYTVTITTAATDVAGNALAGNQALLPAASNYEWSFTTAAPIPPANITVASVFPAAGALAVCPSSSISATFTVPNVLLRINPLTVTAATFTVAGPGVGGPVVAAASRSVDLPTGLIATFVPAAPLTPGLYTATIVSGAAGVMDTAIPGDQLAADFTWTFTVVPATGLCLAPVPLGTASTFGSLSCAALSGSTLGPTGTTVNGNIGTRLTSTSITNFVGGGPPATPGIVNGTIYASDLPVAGDTTSATAISDAYVAFLSAQIVGLASANVVPSSDLGAVAGFGPNPLTPGTFSAGAYQSGTSLAISTALTLDAQGDANAVWIFYSPSTLTTTGLGSVNLINNAQAKNVYWVVGSAATLSAPAFSGDVLAATAISVDTVAVTVDGRLLTSGPTCAAVTFDAHLHTVNVPAP
jgi:hypothetical protein